MAKGNLGNILQHFVAIMAADELLAQTGRFGDSVFYLDAFAMQPWEKLGMLTAGGAVAQPRKDFSEQYARMPGRAMKQDIVAKAFVQAGQQNPNKAAKGYYPNTAALLCAAFPTHPWEMDLLRSMKRSVANFQPGLETDSRNVPASR